MWGRGGGGLLFCYAFGDDQNVLIYFIVSSLQNRSSADLFRLSDVSDDRDLEVYQAQSHHLIS